MHHHKWENAVIPCALAAITSLASAGVSDDMGVNLLHANDGASSDHFGSSVAISGDLCLVGAPDDDDLGDNSGSVHVFRAHGGEWHHEAKLTASNGAAGDQFGSVLAVNKGTIVVGARKHDGNGSNSGAAYVFNFVDNAWAEQAQLFSPDNVAGDQFGGAVAVFGNTVAVGAKGDDDAGTSSGSVHIFQIAGPNWAYITKLTASDGSSGDFFGRAIALSSNVLAVGAYGDDREGVNNGSAYVFRRNEDGWHQDQKLTASVSNDALFGWSVATAGNLVVVGAPGDGEIASAGSIHSFRYDPMNQAWHHDGALTASTPAAFDRLGKSVAVSENIIAAGAPLRDGDYPDMGAVHLFTHNGIAWQEEAPLIPSSGYYWDEFGSACAFSGNTLVAGAPEDDDAGNNAGSATTFSFASVVPCAADFDGDGTVGSNDMFMLVDAWGACGACIFDLNEDGDVGLADLVLLIALWGSCE